MRHMTNILSTRLGEGMRAARDFASFWKCKYGSRTVVRPF